MTEPSRSSPDTHGTEAESAGQLDDTLARPEGAVVLSPLTKKIREPEFAPPTAPGEVGTLGRYRVLKKLGQGGMGAVYLGYDVKLGRKIALKVMLPEHTEDPESRERFLREARAAAMLKSDHVVTLFDVGEERGVAFIAMEYLSGYPLDQYLRNTGELPLAQVFRIGRETAMGLAAAHDLGLVHRDIKPGNIWLEAPKGRVKILDFGLARAANDDTHLTTTGLVVGTPAFMSPEQARGQSLDGRSDLFSLGIVLYRLATGKMPFDGTTTMALLTSLAVDEPVPVRKLNATAPPALEAVIHKLLAKNPAERYATAWEAAAALRDAERAPAADGQLPLVVQPVPMAIAAQSDNVWAGIEESASHAVPISSGTDAVPAEAPPTRRKPEPAPSKLPLLVAGVVLLAAIAVLAVVLAGPKKDKEPVQVTPAPGGGPGGVQPPKIDPERKAAEAVFRAGGFVCVNGDTREIAHASDLPKGALTLTRVNLSAKGGVTDAGLAPLGACKGPLALYLDRTPITDAGLAHFKGTAAVTVLDLGEAKVGDAGLANFANCAELGVLSLHRTEVSEQGLRHFKGSRSIVTLRLSEMKNLTDVSLLYFAENAHLESLILAGSPVGDEGLGHLKDCKNLAHLDLANTAAGDGTVAHFRDAELLRILTLAGSKVTDDGVAHLKDNKYLEVLHLDRTGITDDALPHLTGCTRLTYLDVSGTKVTEPKVRELAKALPGCRIKWNALLIEPAQPPDRRAAEYALSVGGVVSVMVGAGPRLVKARAELPDEPFTLVTLNVSNNQKVTDAGLAAVRGCKNIRFLYLNSSPQLTDAALEHFAGMTGMIDIMLYDTAVGDAGLAHLKDCTDLSVLYLHRTKVTSAGLAHLKNCTNLKSLSVANAVADAGLAHLKGRKSLEHLDLRSAAVTDEGLELCKAYPNLTRLYLQGTKVTAGKVAEVAKALPACRIEWDGGTIEPKAGADRAAAEWVLSVGGKIRVNDSKTLTSDLPKGEMKLAGVSLTKCRDATDANLARFAQCPNIVSLSLIECPATDDGLAHFKHLTGMEVLLLDNTAIGDKGLAHFAGCTRLRVLSLMKTSVTDAGLAHFKACKDLGSLYLTGTGVTDAGLAHLKDCTLITVFLDGTSVTDAGLALFKNYRSLNTLALNGTGVSDAGLIHLAACRNLRLLRFQNTKVTATGAADLAKVLPNCKIEHDGGTIEPPKK
jgi:eukaryotic-like serine/threonine-protein kinase